MAGVAGRAVMARTVLPFSPLDLSPVMWFDASDAASITDAGAGAVSAWNDKSGNARHLAQSTSGNRPVTGTTTQNGLNVIVFDGSNDYLITSNMTIAQPLTYMVVTKHTANTGQGITVAGSGANTPQVYRQTSTNYWSIWAGSAATSTTANDLAAHQITGLFDGTSSTLRLDGTQIKAANAGTTGYSTTGLTVGASSSGSNPMAGFIAELVVCGTITTTDRNTCEAYLKAKWGTP